jgi:hypothetical protein
VWFALDSHTAYRSGSLLAWLWNATTQPDRSPSATVVTTISAVSDDSIKWGSASLMSTCKHGAEQRDTKCQVSPLYSGAMTAAVRLIVLAILGTLLVSGCGEDDDGANTAADSPSAAESTSSTDLSVDDPVDVTLYDADFIVTASGDLAAVETLTLDVPVDDRHGIFRTFDQEVAVEGFTATLDGSPTPIEDSDEDGERVFRIGDPDRTLAVGEHSVRIEYGIRDVITGAEGARQLDWLLIPRGWELDILAADLSVELPSNATEVGCTIGDSQPCDVSGVGTRTLVVETRDLAPHTAVRLQVLMAAS